MKCYCEIIIDKINLRVYPNGKILRSNKTSKKWSVVKGSLNTNGYLYLNINKKNYLIHRIVAHAYLHLDLLSKKDVDHRDQNPLNNAIWNLRVVSHQENLWNNSSKGYCKFENGYRVYYSIDDTRKFKFVKTEEEAIQCRNEMKKKYYKINEVNYKEIMDLCIKNIK